MLQSQDNCFGKFMTTHETSMLQANIHFAHQSILHIVYKHSLSTKVYDIVCSTNKTYLNCTPKYIIMVESSLEFTRLNQALRHVTRDNMSY